MKQKNTKEVSKNSLTLRIIVGAYLFYIVFMLLKGFTDLGDRDKIINILFIGLFTVIGMVLLFTSIRSWIRIDKEEKADGEKAEKIDQIEDNQRAAQDTDSEEAK